MASILKKIGKALGKALKVAAPLAGLIPGIGIPAAAALGAGGKLLGRTLSGQNTFGAGAAGDIAGGALGGAAGKIGGSLLSRVGAPTAGGGPAPGGLLGRIGAGIARDPLKAAQIGLAGINTIQGAQQQSRANDLNQQVLAQAQGDQANRNQLMQLVMQRLQAQQGGGGNPFYGKVG